jgi:hypothetical protein
MSLSVNRTSFYTPQKRNKPTFGNEQIIREVAEHVFKGCRRFSPNLVNYAVEMLKTPADKPQVTTLLTEVWDLIQRHVLTPDVIVSIKGWTYRRERGLHKEIAILEATVNPQITEAAERLFHPKKLDVSGFLSEADAQLDIAFQYADELGRKIADKWGRRAGQQPEVIQAAVRGSANYYQEVGQNSRKLGTQILNAV